MIVDEQFAVVSIERCDARNGKKYLRCELSHPSGKIAGKVWEDNFTTVPLSNNKVYRVSGKVDAYGGSLSLVLTNAWEVADESIETYIKARNSVVFDIETAGQDFETLDEWNQQYLLEKLQAQQQDKDKAKQSTALYPLYGQVVAIGMMNPNSGKGQVLIQGTELLKLDNSQFTCQACKDEKNLLEHFWKIISKYEHFISFNGNNFDWPYLLIRSAIQQVKVPFEITRKQEQQTDLMDKFRASNVFSLEALCRAFGITNPKEKGVSGLHVSHLFTEGKIADIANYVVRDVESTSKLYQVWKTYMAGKIVL